MEKVSEAIVRHLETGRRLVIPALGAFIRKEATGELVFVDLLRKDDGVLEGELCSHFGLSAAQAVTQIERFVARARLLASSPGGFAVSGLGVLVSDAEGHFEFRHDPSVAGQPDTASVGTGAPAAMEPARAGSDPGEAGSLAHPVADASRPIAEVLPAASGPSPVVSASTPKKGIVLPSGASYSASHTKSSAPVQSKRRSDKIMIIAIAAAIVAILAMVYGMLNEPKPVHQAAPQQEQLVP